jgi:hypothetical protein
MSQLMNRQFIKQILLSFVLTVSTAGLPALPCLASSSPQLPSAQHQLSANVPLNSYVYDYLEKLDGLGYLQDMRIGAKPYTRMQVAKWVQQMTDAMSVRPDVPPYAWAMLSQLQQTFSQELATLKGNSPQNGIAVKEWTIGETYYTGDSLSHQGSTSTYQPLNINQNGYRYAPHANEVFSLLLEGNVNNHLVVSATPRFSYDNLNEANSDLESGYIKTKVNNVEIQLGKDPMWWGQGSRGSLLLTNNATPQTAFKLSNIDPLKPGGFFKFLGPLNVNVFYSILENDRSDVKYPSFVGFRTDFTPTANFTFGGARTSILGGQGHMLNSGDFWQFLTGHNADTVNADKWNSIAGGDFRWRVPKWNGLQLYGELYGEDQAHALTIIPMPSEVAGLVGAYIPRLSTNGNWDAHLEWAHTTKSWYTHSLYRNGYTYKGDIMGDAMGNNANRYYAKLTYFSLDGSQFTLNLERVAQQSTEVSPQTIDSIWLSMRTKIEKDMYMNASFGVADIRNVDYTGGNKARNYIISMILTKEY